MDVLFQGVTKSVELVALEDSSVQSEDDKDEGVWTPLHVDYL